MTALTIKHLADLYICGEDHVTDVKPPERCPWCSGQLVPLERGVSKTQEREELWAMPSDMHSWV